MNALRVALVSLHTSPLETPGTSDAGGMNVYVVALGEALARSGVEVELITRRTHDDQPATEFTGGGVPVRFLTAGPPRVVLKEDLPPVVGRFQSALAELPSFDVLHSHYWLSGLAALPVASMWHAPHIQSLHTVAALKNDERGVSGRAETDARLGAERLLVRRSAATITSTSAERESILRHYEARPDRVHVIEPGVDGTLFRPEGAPDARWAAEANPAACASLSSEPFLLTLGRIQPLKGYDLAIRTIAAMPPSGRPRLVIAGSATPGEHVYAAGLAALAVELGVADRVVFAGPQSRAQAAELIRRASVLLLPSLSETYGLVALEAAASGTPVISTRASGMALSVRDGVTGVLLPDRSPQTWAAAVSRLLGNETELARLSASAAEFGARQTWQHTAEQTLALYRQAARP